MRFAMRARFVDAEHISAALSAYLLVGILFGFLYWMLQQACGRGAIAVFDYRRSSHLR